METSLEQQTPIFPKNPRKKKKTESNCLEVQALLWSEYKHHCTLKFLVAITPNGAVSWVSPCYGGRTTDIYIVQDSGFLDILQPYDTVMADCGFKIKSDLTFHRCFLAIPPSAAKGNQMTSSDIRETRKVEILALHSSIIVVLSNK